MPSTEFWINKDEPGWSVTISLDGYDPYRHSPDAALRRIMAEAKKALREAERVAADAKAHADG